MGALALFLVLTGGIAYGANTVFSSDIVNGEVKSVDIGTGEVSTADIADDAVNKNKILAGAVRSADVLDGTLTGGDVLDNSLTGTDIDATTLNGGGDVSGPLSNLQIGHGAVGRTELASGAPQGCCVISFFEFSVGANACQTQAFGFDEANLGEVLIAFPESSDLGAGVYMRPTVVAHPGQGILEICNSTGSSVTIPFGTFFQLRLIG
jgi:hypothetical protein